jgi:tetratricopeptide (TPR) repeat protein
MPATDKHLRRQMRTSPIRLAPVARGLIPNRWRATIGVATLRAIPDHPRNDTGRFAARIAILADIFVSYTSSDSEWAQWIALDLRALGHEPHVHEWEIGAGHDILAWMEQHHAAADHVLCVVSDAYLKAPYSTLERNAAVWRAAKERADFVLFVVVRPSPLPALVAQFRRCEVFGLPEAAARQRFRDFMTARQAPARVAFPGHATAESNITIAVPHHFMGRAQAMAEIEATLARCDGRAAITALRGMRGVGKTVLAVAYADKHKHDYRATWWVRAETADTMRTDLAALGYRMGWAGDGDSQDAAVARTADRLRREGEGILLIFDNALDRDGIAPFLPLGGAAHVLITSNAHAWRGVAEAVTIRLWPREIGAAYLLARTRPASPPPLVGGGRGEGLQAAAEALSVALDGLPLAHEMAAAYCEELGLSLAAYHARFAATPAEVLDAADSAPADYHDRTTVAKTFALAIEAAARRHPAAEPLLVAAALLPPEPIPLFLFEEGRAKLADGLAALLDGRGLEQAVAALRRFALVELEVVPDERDPAVTTDTIRLHRLVGLVAGWRREGEAAEAIRRGMIAALAAVYPAGTYGDPRQWPRARRLDAIATELLATATELPAGLETDIATVLDHLAGYRQAALGAYASARTLFERALKVRETTLGAEHPGTATSLNNLAMLLLDTNRLDEAEPLMRRMLRIMEAHNYSDLAGGLNNVALLLRMTNRLSEAEPLYRRALVINEASLGKDHPHIARNLNNLAQLLQDTYRLGEAEPLMRRALAIDETSLGKDHPSVAIDLNNLATLLQVTNRVDEAEPLMRRALAIHEASLGKDHPNVAIDLNNLATLLQASNRLGEAEPLMRRALAIHEANFGKDHPNVAIGVNNLARLLQDTNRLGEAAPLMRRALAIFLAFQRDTGHAHPHRDAAIANYRGLLAAMGKSEVEIDAELAALWREAGFA